MTKLHKHARLLSEESRLPKEIRELVDLLQISTREGELLRRLADQAVSEHSSDEDAIRWLDREVRNRHPALWKKIVQRSAQLRHA
jgi:hypothetical protein